MDWNYRVDSVEYFADRLAEPWLLNTSMAFGSSVAVPIGKLRRGGELGMFEARWWRRSAQSCIEELKALPGFPRLRIGGRWIRWGDDQPTSELSGWHGTLVFGCYYGYKTTAIIDMVEAVRSWDKELGPISRRALIRLIQDARKTAPGWRKSWLNAG